jgi:hypothetical protein
MTSWFLQGLLIRLLELNVCVKEFSRDNVTSAIFLLELDVFVLKSLVENVSSAIFLSNIECVTKNT